jgi:hypothetical protein
MDLDRTAAFFPKLNTMLVSARGSQSAHAVGAMAVYLEASREASQMGGWTLVLAVGFVDIGDARRLRAAQDRSSRA